VLFVNKTALESTLKNLLFHWKKQEIS
jgi:hypothetical protein